MIDKLKFRGNPAPRQGSMVHELKTTPRLTGQCCIPSSSKEPGWAPAVGMTLAEQLGSLAIKIPRLVRSMRCAVRAQPPGLAGRRCSVWLAALCRHANRYRQLCKSKRPSGQATFPLGNPGVLRAEIALQGLRVGGVQRIGRHLNSPPCDALRINKVAATSHRFIRDS